MSLLLCLLYYPWVKFPPSMNVGVAGGSRSGVGFSGRSAEKKDYDSPRLLQQLLQVPLDLSWVENQKRQEVQKSQSENAFPYLSATATSLNGSQSPQPCPHTNHHSGFHDPDSSTQICNEGWGGIRSHMHALLLPVHCIYSNNMNRTIRM